MEGPVSHPYLNFLDLFKDRIVQWCLLAIFIDFPQIFIVWQHHTFMGDSSPPCTQGIYTPLVKGLTCLKKVKYPDDKKPVVFVIMFFSKYFHTIKYWFYGKGIKERTSFSNILSKTKQKPELTHYYHRHKYDTSNIILHVFKYYY